MGTKAVARMIGALFLSAFVLYGGGTALAGRPWGLVLVVLNSLAVVAIGVLLHTVVHARIPQSANGYLVARAAEAIILAIGGLLIRAKALPLGSTLALDVAMVGLGFGSVPLFLSLLTERLLPRWLAGWAVFSYSALALGSLLGLSGLPVAIWFSIPGGLFELVFGCWLLGCGSFSQKDDA